MRPLHDRLPPTPIIVDPLYGAQVQVYPEHALRGHVQSDSAGVDDPSGDQLGAVRSVQGGPLQGRGGVAPHSEEHESIWK